MHAFNNAKVTNEQFDILNDELKPGHWIVDKYEQRIIWNIERAPKKGLNRDFQAWLSTSLRPTIQKASSDMNGCILFTDGSQQKKPTREDSDNVVTGAACIVIKKHHKSGDDVVTNLKLGLGKVTLFDAEMIALAMDINRACRSMENCCNLYIFADNKSALQCILHPETGPSQMSGVLACANIRRWLEKHEENKVHMNWCPSHIGIILNDKVDELAKEATEMYQPEYTLWAYARQIITKTEIDMW